MAAIMSAILETWVMESVAIHKSDTYMEFKQNPLRM